MQRHELEHIIRAAAEVTNRYEFIIIGSQSILGAIPNAPAECLMSMEVDIYPLDAEELADAIDGALGEGSQFHETFGYYAQGVGPRTAILAAGWETRVVRVQNEATNGRVGYCLHPVDLFLAKAAAWRDKDRDFNRVLLRKGYVRAADALAMVDSMPLDDVGKRRLAERIRRLEREGLDAASAQGDRERPSE
jgi:hypothetical protein